MKNRLLPLILLCLLLALPFAAMASEAVMNLVPTERMILPAIDGLEYEKPSVAGEYFLRFKSETANWAMALEQSPSLTEISIQYGVKAPTNLGWTPTKAEFVNGNIWASDSQLVGALSTNPSVTGGIRTFGNRIIAIYTPEKQILSPRFTSTEWDKPHTHAIRWSDDNGNEYYEKMIIRLFHTRDEGVTVLTSQISEGDIEPNSSGANVACTPSGSQICYTFDPATVNASVIHTAITAPEGAKKCIVKYQYRDMPETMDVDATGKVHLPIWLMSNNELIKGTTSQRMSISWLDAQGARIPGKGGALTIMATNISDNHTWMYYIMQERQNTDKVQWQPVPKSRLNHENCVENGYSLFETPYNEQEGLITVSLKADEHATPDNARRLTGAVMTYRVTPPEGAAYVYTTRRTSTPFWTLHSNWADQMEANIHKEEERIDVRQGQPVGGRDNAVFYQLSTPRDNVFLYSTTLETEKDGGAAYLFFWYNAKDELMLVEWVAEQAERMVLQSVSDGHRYEHEIAYKVTGPVFVDPHQRGWKLYAEYQPQVSSNAYRVNLTLKDTNGKPVEDFQDEPIVFYLPYLDGFDYTNCDFSLKHYQDEMSNQFEILSVEATPYGLRFEATSLSPFIVSWDVDAAPPAEPALPTTGDATPVYAAVAGVLLSLLGLCITLRKARKA